MSISRLARYQVPLGNACRSKHHLARYQVPLGNACRSSSAWQARRSKAS